MAESVSQNVIPKSIYMSACLSQPFQLTKYPGQKPDGASVRQTVGARMSGLISAANSSSEYLDEAQQ